MVGRVCTEAAQRKRASWHVGEEEGPTPPRGEAKRGRRERRWALDQNGYVGGLEGGENAGLGVRVAEREMWRAARVARTGWKSGRSCEPRMGIGTREWEKGESVAWKVGGARWWLLGGRGWDGGR